MSLNFFCTFQKHFIIKDTKYGRICYLCGISEEKIAEEWEMILNLTYRGFSA